MLQINHMFPNLMICSRSIGANAQRTSGNILNRLIVKCELYWVSLKGALGTREIGDHTRLREVKHTDLYISTMQQGLNKIFR